MTVTKENVDQFHEFAHRKIESSAPALSWDELLIEWQSYCERDSINAAIQEGLDDVEAGRHQPADDVVRELRDEFGFSE
ncbi:MAG: hypothetical protein KDA52_02515 [Planctomycetaceae bacterium]|nr:hypothetical protein [Planctomycetaceae bacterium]